jgi:hypothetical protein
VKAAKAKANVEREVAAALVLLRVASERLSKLRRKVA